MRDKKYTVYKHTAPSGKVYIGLTCCNPKERWDSGHGYKRNFHFWNAIQKYGWQNIQHEIVATNLTQKQACDLEKDLIQKYDSTNPNKGYNVLAGGTYGFTFHHTDESKNKISQASKKLWESEEHRKYMSERCSGENNPFYGKHHTNETREKIKKHAKEHPLTDDEIQKRVERLRQANLGIKRRKESVEKSARAKWKKVKQLSKDGELIKVWDSAKEACETLHIQKSTVCQCCKGVKKTAGGYRWEYAN